ncbi:IS4 family transposase, partial [Salmonella enterica subsp. diarizonae]|nr:IS4 family transposase [Salmonella enterica subsp. diarizonae]
LNSGVKRGVPIDSSYAQTIGQICLRARGHSNEPIKCIHNVVLREYNEKSHEVTLSVRWKKILVMPPIGKSKQYPDITLFAIHAREENETPGRNHLEWKLLTNILVVCNNDAIEKLEWYTHRWKIETFHKVLKSGCKAEDSKLRTAERLSKLISCFCIISWRSFWLTMVSREYSDVPAEMALTQAECELLDNVIKDNKKTENAAPLHRYIIKLAQLGGYLARANDPPPGNTVLWRGLRRLNDIPYGFELSRE